MKTYFPLISTDIFVIPLLDRYLIYAPLRRVAFFTNTNAVNLLFRLRQGIVEPANDDEASFLQFCGQVLLTGTEGDWPISTLGHSNFEPTEVTLFLTTRCNLHCIYCYASAGDRLLSEMSLDTARRGIDFVWQNALKRGKSNFGVGYHGGGEPTVHWEVLRESFTYARQVAQKNGLEVYGSLATNGVLSAEQRQWIIKNFRGVNLSIDGFPAIQDLQRPVSSGKSSSSIVLQTIKAFDKAKFSYGIRITVTARSVDVLPQSIAYLLKTTHPKHIQVEPVYDLGRGQNEKLRVDTESFIDGFLQAQQLADERGVNFFFSASRIDVLTNRFCQSCGEGFNLTPSGYVSACYEVPDEEFDFNDQFIFGNYDEKDGHYVFDENKLMSLRNNSVEKIPWCQSCFCKWHCAGDCVYKARHAMIDGQFMGDQRCEITRALTLAQIINKIEQNGGKVWAEKVNPSLYIVNH